MYSAPNSIEIDKMKLQNSFKFAFETRLRLHVNILLCIEFAPISTEFSDQVGKSRLTLLGRENVLSLANDFYTNTVAQTFCIIFVGSYPISLFTNVCLVEIKSMELFLFPTVSIRKLYSDEGSNQVVVHTTYFSQNFDMNSLGRKY